MTTYAIKVQNTMRPTNPRYSTEGPMTLYYYIGKMVGQLDRFCMKGTLHFVVLKLVWRLT